VGFGSVEGAYCRKQHTYVMKITLRVVNQSGPRSRCPQALGPANMKNERELLKEAGNRTDYSAGDE